MGVQFSYFFVFHKGLVLLRREESSATAIPATEARLPVDRQVGNPPEKAIRFLISQDDRITVLFRSINYLIDITTSLRDTILVRI